MRRSRDRAVLAALLLIACVPWAQLARIVRAAVVALLVSGCSCATPAAPPLFPPGPTIAAHVLAHGQVGLAAAFRQDSLEAIDAVKPSGDERADWFAKAAAQSEVDERWLPVWHAWHDLKSAQNAYEAAAARGGHTSDTEVITALCALRDAVPTRWRAMISEANEVCQ